MTGADGRGVCANVCLCACGPELHGFCRVNACADTVLDTQCGAGWGTKGTGLWCVSEHLVNKTSERQGDGNRKKRERERESTNTK